MADGERPETRSMTTAADLIAAALAEAGVTRAFGLPGGEVLAVMAALDRAGIAFQLVKHENAGAFMAEGAHHAAPNAPAVLVATIGPGLANAVNAILNAAQDQTPLVVIAGCVDDAEAETYTHQVFDQAGFLRPVVKGAWRLSAGAVGEAVSKALRTAMAAPQGPVLLDLPVSLAEAPQPEPPVALAPAEAAAAPAEGPALERARAMLAAAERPVLLAGVGAVLHEAGPAIQSVCERFGAPLLTTYKAKGVVDEAHPLCLGGHGLSPVSDGVVLPLLAEADLVLSVGYDPIEMRTGWRAPFSAEAHVEIAHLPNRHGMHGAAVSFVCDVRAGLERIAAELAPAGPTWPDGAPAAARATLADRFGDRADWGPHQAFAAARRACPPETVATVDSGAHRILMSQMWCCPSPRTLLQSTAFCTMGVGLPMAVGRKLAEPSRPVLAVTGDAGLEMVLGELATLRDLKLGLPVLVLVDESLGLIELKQRRSGLSNLGVDFPGTDWPAVAQALGGAGRWITSSEDLEAELSAAFDRETFTLLPAVIGRQAYDGAF